MAIALDGLEDADRIEGPHRGKGAGTSACEVMEHGQAGPVGDGRRMEEDIRGDGRIDIQEELLGHRDQHPVSQHGPLRMAGRPRRVEDPGQVLRLDGRARDRGCLILQQRFVREILPSPGAGKDELLDRLEPFSHPAHVRPELGACDQGERSGVVQHVGVFVRVEPDVHWHRGHPRLDRPEDRFEALGAVGHEQAHPVTRLSAEGHQRSGEPANPISRLPERHGPSGIDPGRSLRVSFGSARQEIASIHGVTLWYLAVDNIGDSMAG